MMLGRYVIGHGLRMRIRSLVLRRVVPVAVGVGAILAGSTDLAQATDELPRYSPAKISDPGRCGWSTHWQTGKCVDVESPVIPATGSFRAAFLCPDKYPYPFEGAFSGNPTWHSRSTNVRSSASAVAANGLADQIDFFFQKELSFAGSQDVRGVISPGYVVIAATVYIGEFTISVPPFLQGRYQCSDTPANPL